MKRKLAPAQRRLDQMPLTIDDRVEIVRAAISEAATGLQGDEYRELMERLVTDADGWRMELEELE